MLEITNFIVVDSERTVAKGVKIDRWKKILISAMKQSLRNFLPKITVLNTLEEIKEQTGNKLYLSKHQITILRIFRCYPC